jgi:beta-glucosidase
LERVGFDRITLAPHTKQRIHFTVDARAMSAVDANGDRAVRAGDYELHLGGGQPNNMADGSLATSFTIRGYEELPR